MRSRRISVRVASTGLDISGHAAEIRSIDTVEELNSVATTVKPEEMKLAKQVISTFEGPLDLANYKDEYREGLQRIPTRRRSRSIDDEVARAGEMVRPSCDEHADARLASARCAHAQSADDHSRDAHSAAAVNTATTFSSSRAATADACAFP